MIDANGGSGEDDGAAGARPGVAWEKESSPDNEVRWLLAAPEISVTRWRCCCSDLRSSGEKHQRWHVIAFPHAGSFVIEGSRGRGVVDANWVALYNPDEGYRTAHPFGCQDHGSALVVGESALRQLLAELRVTAGERAQPAFPLPRQGSEARLFLRQHQLVAALDAGTIGGAAAAEAALGIVEDVVSAAFGATPERTPNAQAAAITEAVTGFLHERFRTSPSLHESAAAAQCSIWHLCRVFRQTSGRSVHAYLDQLRLREALRLLAEGVDDLTDLALDLGFSSHSHFTSAFRREFGQPPSRLRRRAASRRQRRIAGACPADARRPTGPG